MVPVLCCVFLFVLVVGTVSAGSLDTSSDSVSVDSVGASDVSVEDCNGPVSVDSVGVSDVSVEDCNGLVGDVDLDNSSYTDKGSCYVSNKGFGDGISCLGASKISTKIESVSVAHTLPIQNSASKISTKIEASNLNMYYDTGKYVVAYLKTSGGKAISGQSVKISIDGRSWTKTTDSNGKVTLQIVTLTPKVYPCTIQFAGTTSYAKYRQKWIKAEGKIQFAGTTSYAASSKSINVTVKRYTS